MGAPNNGFGPGAEALGSFADHHEDIDLVVLDMITPNRGEEDTFRRMRRIAAHARVLMASGFNQQGMAESPLAEGAAGFVHNPFLIDELARTIANCRATPVSPTPPRG